MWLKCASSNHKPGLIAGYYLDSVAENCCYPAKVRTDCGTENTIIAAIQSFATGLGVSGHLYGTSPGNQRIEAWWSFFRRNRTQFWIELFEQLVEFGVFHPGNSTETDCLRFCFMSVIQKDLNCVRQQWNTHRIRPSRGARCPAGVPDELYYLPEAPATRCGIIARVPLPQQILIDIETPKCCEDTTLYSYLQYLCSFHQWRNPETAQHATELYFKLFPYVQ